MDNSKTTGHQEMESGVSNLARSTDAILSDLPDLTPEDVTEALRFAAEAVRERELPLRHSA
jgi:hypothetical protein